MRAFTLAAPACILLLFASANAQGVREGPSLSRAGSASPQTAPANRTFQPPHRVILPAVPDFNPQPDATPSPKRIAPAQKPSHPRPWLPPLRRHTPNGKTDGKIYWALNLHWRPALHSCLPAAPEPPCVERRFAVVL